MNVFSKIIGLLPLAILAIEKIAGDLQGHQKKQMVTDILQAAAQGVAQASPENAGTAQAAADLATSMIDGVVAIVKPQAKAQPAASAPAPASTQEVAAAAIAQ